MELAEVYCPYHLVVIGNARVSPHTALLLVREHNLWLDANRLCKKKNTQIKVGFLFLLQVNGTWGLPSFVCDFYIAMDVTCSTSSIFNLVAISIDR